jgi:hypothetical protein
MTEEEKDYERERQPPVVIGQPVALATEQVHPQNWSRYRISVPVGVYSGDQLSIQVGTRVMIVKSTESYFIF